MNKKKNQPIEQKASVLPSASLETLAPIELAKLAALLALGHQSKPELFLPQAIRLYQAAVRAKEEFEKPLADEYLLLCDEGHGNSTAQEYIAENSKLDLKKLRSVLEGFKKQDIYTANEHNRKNWNKIKAGEAEWLDGETIYKTYLRHHQSRDGGWKIERAHLDQFLAFRRKVKKLRLPWKGIRQKSREEIAAEVAKEKNPK